LVAALAQTGDEVAEKIGAASDGVAQRFAKGVGDIESSLAVVGDTLSRGFDDHSSSVVQRIEALGLRLSQTIGGENDRLATRLADVSGRLEETLSTQGGALDATLADSAERLAARVREHVEGARTVFEDAESQLNALLSAAHQVARDDFAARGQALHENLTRDLSQTAVQLGEHANAVQERFAAVAVDAVSAIGVQGDRVTETLAERLRAFEQIVLTRAPRSRPRDGPRAPMCNRRSPNRSPPSKTLSPSAPATRRTASANMATAWPARWRTTRRFRANGHDGE